MKKTIKNTQFIRSKLKKCLNEKNEIEDNLFEELEIASKKKLDEIKDELCGMP